MEQRLSWADKNHGGENAVASQSSIPLQPCSLRRALRSCSLRPQRSPRTRPSISSSRIGCRRRIRCKRRCRNGAPRSRRHQTARSSSRFIRRNSSARRSTITTWRATASRISTYVNPGYQPGRFPIICGRRTAVPRRRRQGRHPRDRCLVPEIRGDRDEGREVLLLLHPRSADLALQQEEDRGAVRHQGNEGPAVTGHGCRLGHAAWRHQRAGQRDRGARRAGEGRRGSGDFPVGLGAAARRRQGHEVPHGRAAPHRHVPVADEPQDLQRHVGGAEEGDRRPLHHRMGRQVRRSVGGRSSVPASRR